MKTTYNPQSSFYLIQDHRLIKQEPVEAKSEYDRARDKLSGIVSILKNEEFTTPLGKLY
jgi:hypothetical protein